MKIVNNQIITIWIFAFAFIINASSQESKVYDTIQLKEVIIPSGFPIDTTVQKILFVLEKQPLGKEPCEQLDFIVLYDDHSGLSFDMGSIINIDQIYWAFKQDTIIFYSTRIYNKVKLIKKSDQIAEYLLVNGERKRLGNRAFGFDCLIQDTPGYYRSNNNFIYSYLFKREEKLNKCHLEFYYRTNRKK